MISKENVMIYNLNKLLIIYLLSRNKVLLTFIYISLCNFLGHLFDQASRYCPILLTQKYVNLQPPVKKFKHLLFL